MAHIKVVVHSVVPALALHSCLRSMTCTKGEIIMGYCILELGSPFVTQILMIVHGSQESKRQ